MEDALVWTVRPLVHRAVSPPGAGRKARVNSNPGLFFFFVKPLHSVGSWVLVLEFLSFFFFTLSSRFTTVRGFVLFCFSNLVLFFSLQLSAMVQTWVNPNISADFIIVQFCILSIFKVINLKKDHLVYSFSNWCIIHAIFIKSCFFNYFIQVAYCSCQQLFIFKKFCIVLKRKLSKMSWMSKKKNNSL